MPSRWDSLWFGFHPAIWNTVPTELRLLRFKGMHINEIVPRLTPSPILGGGVPWRQLVDVWGAAGWGEGKLMTWQQAIYMVAYWKIIWDLCRPYRALSGSGTVTRVSALLTQYSEPVAIVFRPRGAPLSDYDLRILVYWGWYSMTFMYFYYHNACLYFVNILSDLWSLWQSGICHTWSSQTEGCMKFW